MPNRELAGMPGTESTAIAGGLFPITRGLPSRHPGFKFPATADAGITSAAIIDFVMVIAIDGSRLFGAYLA
jgi:hypothetical protein